MKSLLLVYENAADEVREELDGRTPLQVARCPAATRLASEGVCGVLGRPPAGEGARAEALLAALLGVPRADAWRLARGPLEAESVGADWNTHNYAYRADMITSEEGVIRDARLARLTRPETDQLTGVLQDALDPLNARIMSVGPGHAVVLVQQDDLRMEPGFAPWLLEGEDEAPQPEGKRAKSMRAIMQCAAHALSQQTINDVRVDLGENPASALWLWGGGGRTELLEKFGGRPLKGVMLTQSAMARGLAMSLGLTVEPLLDPWLASVPSDVVDAARMARLFKEFDIVVVYVEAAIEMIRGPASEKVRFLERMDLLLTGPLLEAAKKVKHRRFVLATLPAAAGRASRSRAPQLPVVVWGAHVNADAVPHWDEAACADGELENVEPVDVFGRLVGG
jgi:2,3-bisphosphoglycerate-independent phosphoglycerate mutase